MRKLEGNERWRGKMLLTEHQQQYDGRNKVLIKQQSPEERLMVRDYVVLLHMLT
ncbi:hypothetical protein [Paenibacillus sp. D9]|uniref:hypothetical protein n=1 Tax=Paenibacillus sp. D9 TaxID=665792 RepID=UPI0012EDFCF5|nr:hypothetical protein [Paenibacillus sp. D9]